MQEDKPRSGVSEMKLHGNQFYELYKIVDYSIYF